MDGRSWPHFNVRDFRAGLAVIGALAAIWAVVSLAAYLAIR